MERLAAVFMVILYGKGDGMLVFMVRYICMIHCNDAK